MATYGYARVSTKDQNEARQVHKFKELGIEDRLIFVDKTSGKDFDRAEYKIMRRVINEGDLLYLDALDRLGRNYDAVISEWKYITRELKADIVILENPSLFDSRKWKASGDIGRLMEDQFLSLLAYVADQERKKIRSRQADGIERAKATGITKSGRWFGNQKIFLSTEQEKVVIRWLKGDIKKATEAMKLAGLKTNTFYSRAAEIAHNNNIPMRQPRQGWGAKKA